MNSSTQTTTDTEAMDVSKLFQAMEFFKASRNPVVHDGFESSSSTQTTTNTKAMDVSKLVQAMEFFKASRNPAVHDGFESSTAGAGTCNQDSENEDDFDRPENRYPVQVTFKATGETVILYVVDPDGIHPENPKYWAKLSPALNGWLGTG